MIAIQELTREQATADVNTEEILGIYDELDTVDLAFMISRWHGFEINTSHPLNGFLEVASWYGKEFLSIDHVHPLLMIDGKNNLFKITPSLMAMKLGIRFPILKSKRLKSLFRLLAIFSKTEASCARIRMVEYRQKISATMIYDNLPIHDSFRKIDKNTVLGLMDLKGEPRPFFFILKRDQPL